MLKVKNMYVEKVEGILKGSEKPISYDFSYCPQVSSELLKPVIFIHGFKGFKDWGAFNLVADEMARKGFFVFKFNFSFNGTTPKNLTQFVDLHAFGENNFSRELADLDCVLQFLSHKLSTRYRIDLNQLAIVAHSRGGATAIIKSAEDDRIKKLVTWASVGTIAGRIPHIDMVEFQRTGTIYLPNARTQQFMPIHFQFVQDFKENQNRYNLLERARQLSIPVLLIHGQKDATVPIKEANCLAEAIPNSELWVVEDGDHTFGSTEPWKKDVLPIQMKLVVEETSRFLKG